jgi:hypothetical protein
MNRIRGQKGIAPIKSIERSLGNKWPEQRNLLAMATKCDIPDGHHLRESTRDPSFYGGVEQFTATPGQRRGLQFQRQRSRRIEHTQYVGSHRRHHHATVGSIYMVNAGDNLKGDQVGGGRLRSYHRQHEIFHRHRDGDKDVCHHSRRSAYHSRASLTYWENAQLSWLSGYKRSRLLDERHGDQLFRHHAGNERYRHWWQWHVSVLVDCHAAADHDPQRLQ